MNFKSSVIICVCGIRAFRILKIIPYQNVLRPYNSQIINNSYNIRESYHVAGLHNLYLR